jgi:hypothetical protein
VSFCPICEHPAATVATVFYPREGSSNSDASVILDCPTCGTLIDGEIQHELDTLPSVPVADEEEQEICPV